MAEVRKGLRLSHSGGTVVDPLENFASAERQLLKEELAYLKAGSKLFSPSGDDITLRKIEEIEARLEHADKAIRENVAKQRSAD